MKFFVPYAADDAHAEQIWSDAWADLFDLGLPTAKRRIYVGREVPDDFGPAMLIFEASDLDVFYVCTPYNGVLGGEPFVLGLTERGRAIDFDEVVEGHA